jgi:hypothetical protein
MLSFTDVTDRRFVKEEKRSEMLISVCELRLYLGYQSTGESNCGSSSEEIPRLLCNLKVHYRIHKNPPYLIVLPQKLIVAQLVKNFPGFNETRRFIENRTFITAFTRAHC